MKNKHPMSLIRIDFTRHQELCRQVSSSGLLSSCQIIAYPCIFTGTPCWFHRWPRLRLAWFFFLISAPPPLPAITTVTLCKMVGWWVWARSDWVKIFPPILLLTVGNAAPGWKDIGFSSVLFRRGKYYSFLTALIIKQSPGQSFGNQNVWDFPWTGWAVLRCFHAHGQCLIQSNWNKPPTVSFPF